MSTFTLPGNYNEVAPMTPGEFPKVEPGGYICKIMNVELTKSSGGNPMLVFYFDIAEGELKDFYANQYKNDTKDSKVWQGRHWQVLTENSLGMFKGIETALKKSNPSFVEAQPGEQIPVNKYQNMLFGGIFNEREYKKQDGSIGTATNLHSFRSVDTIKSGEFDIPKKETIKTNSQQTNNSADENFFAIGDGLDDQNIPF